jgi:hypothetical protein
MRHAEMVSVTFVKDSKGPATFERRVKIIIKNQSNQNWHSLNIIADDRNVCILFKIIIYV